MSVTGNETEKKHDSIFESHFNDTLKIQVSSNMPNKIIQ